MGDGNFSGVSTVQGQQGAAGIGELDPSRTLKPVFVTDPGAKTFYKIGPTDVLKVTVFQVDELNRTAQVSGNGTINLPLIGQVRAAGRSAQEVETEIAARLKARYLNSPQVTVYIDEYNSQKITVSGSVRKPGVYPVKGQMSLLQAIALAEGLDTVANANNVVVIREQGGGRFVGRFDAEQIRDGRAGDPLLQNGDVVMVDNSAIRTAVRDFAPATGVLGSTATFIGLAK